MKSKTRLLQDRRTHFLLALRELDDAWVATFHKTGFGDVYFSRLFTELWLRGDGAVGKSDAYDLVHGVSVQTAMKSVRQAIAEGYLEEFDNPADGRSRLIRMSPRLRELFNGVIDRASKAFERVFLAPRGRSLNRSTPASGVDKKEFHEQA
jgi:hypothetical protein